MERDLSTLDDDTIATQFESPLRSMFASAQPTSSISASTARASMTTQSPVTTARPSRRSVVDASRSSSARYLRHKDYSAFLNSVSIRHGVPILNRRLTYDPGAYRSEADERIRPDPALFGLHEGGIPRTWSPRPAYGKDPTNAYLLHGSSSLQVHLLTKGFAQGKHSDITICAFGQQYKLHKLLLDRIRFFSAAFSPEWAAESPHELTLVPEDIDPNITKPAFELALKRIYGNASPSEEEEHAIGLFATAQWLDMPDLADICVESILQQMRPSNLHTIVGLVTTNYYGKAGDLLLTSAKAILCRDGWEMPIQHWDAVPSEIVCDVISDDSFYVSGEQERWLLAVKLLNRRLRRLAVASGLISSTGLCLQSRPKNMPTSEATRTTTAGKSEDPNVWNDENWHALYALPEVQFLLKLLDTGIHYVHLTFEQLQCIKAKRDVFGVPVVPRRVVDDALWMAMELRQRILNAAEEDLELGLSHSDDPVEEAGNTERSSEDDHPTEKGKQREIRHTGRRRGTHDGALDEGTSTQRYLIPTSDLSYVIGGCSPQSEWKHASQRGSATAEAIELDDAPERLQHGQSPPRNPATQPRSRSTRFPPFRFCVEFPNARSLKDRKKVYSRTIWYAGSHFNLYIQRVSTGKQSQLGIYLHRTKAPDLIEQFLSLTPRDRDHLKAFTGSIVDRTPNRRNTAYRKTPTDPGLVHHRSPIHEPSGGATEGEFIPMSDPSSDSDPDPDPPHNIHHSRTKIPTLPPYTDPRPTIRTYFKIYTPSRAGRLLCVYESAPDDFEFGKSWGWRSSQMVLDADEDDDAVAGGGDAAGGGRVEKSSSRSGARLRYMVTVGLV